MSSLNNALETKGKESDFRLKIRSTFLNFGTVLKKNGPRLSTYACLLYLISTVFGAFCTGQVRDLRQLQDEAEAAQEVITRKVDKNSLAENTNQPASLNRSGGDTSQVPSNHSESYLGAAEEEIRQKINFFRVADNFFSFLRILGMALMAVCVWFLPENHQEGHKENKL